MTAPVRDGQVVAAKFFGSFVFYLVLWAPSLLYFVIFRWLTGHSAADAFGSYLGAYSMLILVGMFYLSIGCLASALTKNQIVAATIAFALISLMFSLVCFPSFSSRRARRCASSRIIFRPLSTWGSFRGVSSTRARSSST